MEIEKIGCSVGILTFNSAETLRRALESVKDCAEIIICDGGSTDTTRDIAREYGCVILEQNPEFKSADNKLVNYAGARNQLLDASTYDWFLYIDSDEEASIGLVTKAGELAKSLEIAACRVPVRYIMDGKEIKYASNYPGYQHRLFNKKIGARFIKPIHERIEYDKDTTKILSIEEPWYVFTKRSELDNYIANTKKYINSEIRAGRGQSFSDFCKKTLWGNARKSIVVVVKSLRNYSLHGFTETTPIRGEIGRAIYPLLVMWGFIFERYMGKEWQYGE